MTSLQSLRNSHQQQQHLVGTAENVAVVSPASSFNPDEVGKNNPRNFDLPPMDYQFNFPGGDEQQCVDVYDFGPSCSASTARTANRDPTIWPEDYKVTASTPTPTKKNTAQRPGVLRFLQRSHRMIEKVDNALIRAGALNPDDDECTEASAHLPPIPIQQQRIKDLQQQRRLLEQQQQQRRRWNLGHGRKGLSMHEYRCDTTPLAAPFRRFGKPQANNDIVENEGDGTVGCIKPSLEDLPVSFGIAQSDKTASRRTLPHSLLGRRCMPATSASADLVMPSLDEDERPMPSLADNIICAEDSFDSRHDDTFTESKNETATLSTLTSGQTMKPPLRDPISTFLSSTTRCTRPVHGIPKADLFPVVSLADSCTVIDERSDDEGEREDTTVESPTTGQDVSTIISAVEDLSPAKVKSLIVSVLEGVRENFGTSEGAGVVSRLPLCGWDPTMSDSAEERGCRSVPDNTMTTGAEEILEQPGEKPLTTSNLDRIIQALLEEERCNGNMDEIPAKLCGQRMPLKVKQMEHVDQNASSLGNELASVSQHPGVDTRGTRAALLRRRASNRLKKLKAKFKLPRGGSQPRESGEKMRSVDERGNCKYHLGISGRDCEARVSASGEDESSELLDFVIVDSASSIRSATGKTKGGHKKRLRKLKLLMCQWNKNKQQTHSKLRRKERGNAHRLQKGPFSPSSSHSATTPRTVTTGVDEDVGSVITTGTAATSASKKLQFHIKHGKRKVDPTSIIMPLQLGFRSSGSRSCDAASNLDPQYGEPPSKLLCSVAISTPTSAGSPDGKEGSTEVVELVIFDGTPSLLEEDSEDLNNKAYAHHGHGQPKSLPPCPSSQQKGYPGTKDRRNARDGLSPKPATKSHDVLEKVETCRPVRITATTSSALDPSTAPPIASNGDFNGNDDSPLENRFRISVIPTGSTGLPQDRNKPQAEITDASIDTHSDRGCNVNEPALAPLPSTDRVTTTHNTRVQDGKVLNNAGTGTLPHPGDSRIATPPQQNNRLQQRQPSQNSHASAPPTTKTSKWLQKIRHGIEVGEAYTGLRKNATLATSKSFSHVERHGDSAAPSHSKPSPSIRTQNSRNRSHAYRTPHDDEVTEFAQYEVKLREKIASASVLDQGSPDRPSGGTTNFKPTAYRTTRDPVSSPTDSKPLTVVTPTPPTPPRKKAISTPIPTSNHPMPPTPREQALPRGYRTRIRSIDQTGTITDRKESDGDYLPTSTPLQQAHSGDFGSTVRSIDHTGMISDFVSRSSIPLAPPQRSRHRPTPRGKFSKRPDARRGAGGRQDGSSSGYSADASILDRDDDSETSGLSAGMSFLVEKYRDKMDPPSRRSKKMIGAKSRSQDAPSTDQPKIPPTAVHRVKLSPQEVPPDDTHFFDDASTVDGDEVFDFSSTGTPNFFSSEGENASLPSFPPDLRNASPSISTEKPSFETLTRSSSDPFDVSGFSKSQSSLEQPSNREQSFGAISPRGVADTSANFSLWTGVADGTP